MSTYLIAGLALGVGLVMLHVVRAARGRGEAKLERAVELIIHGAGIAVGVRIMVLCVTTKDIKPFGGEDRVYIFIGGVALVWVCGQSIWRELTGHGSRRVNSN